MTRQKNMNQRFLNRSLLTCGVGILFFGSGCLIEKEVPLGQLGRALGSIKVGALQYAAGQANQVKATCSSAPMPDVCAVQELIAQAQSQGALLVVAPELALGQIYYEKEPALDENPATSSSWSEDSLIKIFSKQAKELQIYLVIHLGTMAGSDKHSTQVAYSPAGTVLGIHHKFELFSSEKQTYTPGTDVMVFPTPLGKVGLLICADIYGDLALHSKLAETLGARLLAFSSYWTAKGAANWQASFAKNWQLYVIAANTSSGVGTGGGVFDPEGKALVKTEQATPSLTLAEIPSPGP